LSCAHGNIPYSREQVKGKPRWDSGGQGFSAPHTKKKGVKREEGQGEAQKSICTPEALLVFQEDNSIRRVFLWRNCEDLCEVFRGGRRA